MEIKETKEIIRKYGYGGKTHEVKAATQKEEKELKKLKPRGKITGKMNYSLGRSLGYNYR